MPIIELNKYRFRQYEVQSRGGLCCGISLALLTDLAEHHDEQNLRLSASKSFDYAQDFTKMIKASRNILMSETIHGFEALRQKILNLQVRNSSKKFNEVKNKSIQGAVLLILSVGGVEARCKAGSAFKTYDWDYAQNHMGLAIFDASGNVFVFDPNCGGILVNWQQDACLPTAVELVDSVLLRMYRLYDRENGKRTASIKKFEYLNYNELPFGDSVS